MKVWKTRPKDLGILMVVGGPGGSGSSTIARQLARYYGLHYAYAGGMMREFAKSYGYSNYSEFQESKEYKTLNKKIDGYVDEHLLKLSYQENMLIEGKVFAALATIYKIPTTVKIWLHADIGTRVRRTLNKIDLVSLTSKLAKRSKLYMQTASELMARYSNDKNRYQKLYGIDYTKPELYNDIVLDTSKQKPGETFELIVRMIKDGRYIK